MKKLLKLILCGYILAIPGLVKAQEAQIETPPIVVTDAPVSAGSAAVKQVVAVKELAKKSYKADEHVRLEVENGSAEAIKVTLFDVNGSEVGVETKKSQQDSMTVIELVPAKQMRPGRYRLKIEDQYGETSTQDFTWGVLAINTNKSSYSPNSSALISMAVLDETGEMVCDALLRLEIKASDGQVKVFSSQEGTIIVNPQCYSKEVTVIPDYQATYTVGGVGSYNLKLTAETHDGVYTIDDAFEVSDSIPFDVDRLAATRFYPPSKYPVSIKITASEDFDGVVQEMIPAGFVISQYEGTRAYDEIEMRAEQSTQNVLGATIFAVGNPFEGKYKPTQRFGSQHRDPTLAQKYTAYGVTGHDGIDFPLPEGTGVVAAEEGRVVRAGDGDYGVTIVIEHSWGKSYYGHLSKVMVSEGTEVKKGQIIGQSGSTGLSSGPHLHFGIKPNDNDFENGYYGKVNPLPYLGIAEPSELEGVVAGIQTTSQESIPSGTQLVKWRLNLKKGESVTLGYQYDAPDISPELYRTGPLEFWQGSELKFRENRQWMLAADSVVVTGGITNAEAQFGGLQRKVAKVNSNWYAFTNDGTDVTYSKSSNGVTWNAPVDVDATDADNYNPAISVSGNIIHVFWMDESADLVEGKQIDTGSSDALGTLCQLASPGAYTVSSYFPTVASLSTTAAIVAYSDSSTGTNEGAYEVTGLNGTCAGTALATGNVFSAAAQLGHGFADSDRPVGVAITSTTGGVVYQDGDLSWSYYDASTDEWQNNNQTIASVTDNIYSVTTDGTSIWVLTVDTAQTDETRLYKCCTVDINEQEIDADAGANADDDESDIDMYCIDSSDCKIVYTDDLDGTSTIDLIFIDCGSNGAGGRDAAGADPHCTTRNTTNIDSDIGTAAGDVANPDIYCVTSANCKVAYGDDIGTAAPQYTVIDCNDEDCDTPSAFDVHTDFGAATDIPYISIDCIGGDTDCKVVLSDQGTVNDLSFIDCSANNCGSTTLVDIDTAAGGAARNELYCVSATNCKVIYNDVASADVVFVNCGGAGTPASCTTLSGDTTIIDGTVGATEGTVHVDVDCVGGDTECRAVYTDDSATAGCAVAGAFCFVDCNNSALCASPALTSVDLNGSNAADTASVGLHCISISDCKFIYVGESTAGSEDLYFGDCDNDTCTTGSVYDLPGPRLKGAVWCVATDDCKMAYYEGTTGTQPTVVFADCDTAKCLPTWSSQTAPFASATNLISASITYDSTNTDLYASAIKDASEKAYWKMSDAGSISWGSETDFGFTAADLDHISTPHTAAGVCEVASVLRQGTNFEFKFADSATCEILGPTMDQVMRHGAWFSGGSEQAFTF